MKQLGVKGRDKNINNKLTGSSSFVEHKKNNLGINDMKNYETNINSMNRMNIGDKEKKYEDRRRAIKEQIGNTSSFATNRDIKNKEIKGKNNEDATAKKQKLREAMLAKIGKGKAKKPIGQK